MAALTADFLIHVQTGSDNGRIPYATRNLPGQAARSGDTGYLTLGVQSQRMTVSAGTRPAYSAVSRSVITSSSSRADIRQNAGWVMTTFQQRCPQRASEHREVWRFLRSGLRFTLYRPQGRTAEGLST